MSKLKIQGMDGAAKGEIEIPDGLLCLDGYEQAVHDAATAIAAGRRAGSASTLGKGDVAGSGKKPWRQKGTGMARAGYRRSPIWRGGGVSHGPHPRSHAWHLPRKIARGAFRRVLSDRIASGALKVVDRMELPESKTGAFRKFLKSIGVTGSVLVLVGKADPKLMLAARNIREVEIVGASEVNVRQLLRYSVLVADAAGVDCLKQRLERDVA